MCERRKAYPVTCQFFEETHLFLTDTREAFRAPVPLDF